MKPIGSAFTWAREIEQGGADLPVSLLLPSKNPNPAKNLQARPCAFFAHQRHRYRIQRGSWTARLVQHREIGGRANCPLRLELRIRLWVRREGGMLHMAIGGVVLPVGRAWSNDRFLGDVAPASAIRTGSCKSNTSPVWGYPNCATYHRGDDVV